MDTRNFDIELTNACNAKCAFCPRDKTPKPGLMTPENFRKTVERAQEYHSAVRVNMCGLGEPLLHPRVVEFTQYLTDQGVYSVIGTNASRLTAQLSDRLIAAGLKRLCASISGIDEQYREIYHLSFSEAKSNFLHFMSVAGGKCEIALTLVPWGPVKDDLENIKAYWREHGIQEFIVFDVIHRGGSLDLGYSFVGNDRFLKEARELVQENAIDPMCYAPFLSPIVGWDGNYYMCCHDFEKRFPLGSVFDYTIKEIEVVKERRVKEERDLICGNCDLDVINRIREVLFKVDQGKAKSEDVERKLRELKGEPGLG